ncbi:UNVERIFIED_CONTAM: hypothetical protein RMT77_000561 [Armadillidium vulgare]
MFFRIIVKNFKEAAVSWPVNLELVEENKNVPVKDKKLNPSSFLNKVESHLFLINQYSSNRCSIQMEDVAHMLLKIFQKSMFKFKIVLENCEHRKYILNEKLDISNFELKIRRFRWWNLSFYNIGLKNKFLFHRTNDKDNKEHKKYKMIKRMTNRR